MAFRKLERQPAGGGGTRNTSVRIFHVSKQGPTIVIPAEVGRLAGIEPNSRGNRTGTARYS